MSFLDLKILNKRYEKIQKIGEGGYSNIFLCKDMAYRELGKVNKNDNNEEAKEERHE